MMKRYFWYLSAVMIVTMIVFNTASYGNSAPQILSYEQNFDSVNAGGFENLADPLWSSVSPIQAMKLI